MIAATGPVAPFPGNGFRPIPCDQRSGRADVREKPFHLLAQKFCLLIQFGRHMLYLGCGCSRFLGGGGHLNDVRGDFLRADGGLFDIARDFTRRGSLLFDRGGDGRGNFIHRLDGCSISPVALAV